MTHNETIDDLNTNFLINDLNLIFTCLNSISSEYKLPNLEFRFIKDNVDNLEYMQSFEEKINYLINGEDNKKGFLKNITNTINLGTTIVNEIRNSITEVSEENLIDNINETFQFKKKLYFEYEDLKKEALRSNDVLTEMKLQIYEKRIKSLNISFDYNEKTLLDEIKQNKYFKKSTEYSKLIFEYNEKYLEYKNYINKTNRVIENLVEQFIKLFISFFDEVFSIYDDLYLKSVIDKLKLNISKNNYYLKINKFETNVLYDELPYLNELKNILNNINCKVNYLKGFIVFLSSDDLTKFINSTSENITMFKNYKRILLDKYQLKEFDNKDCSYVTHIQSIENVKFEKIRKYCENLTKENKADEMQIDLAQNGKMKKALIYDALEQFIETLNGETITLIDWGCEQAIGSMLVLDYIKEKQLNITVSEVFVMDTDEQALIRAVAQVDSLKQNELEIITLDSNNGLDKLNSIQNSTALNLIVNDTMPVNSLDIDFDMSQQTYFICVSNENKTFLNEVYEDISIFNDIQNLSIREVKIGRFKKFERIFRINNG